MFGKGVELFKLFGFSVRVDASWLIIAVLVVWSLTVGFFPEFYPDLSTNAYLAMGIAGGLGLFASIIFHELAHSLVARGSGMEMRGITLFVFGGVAEMDEEPSTPAAEFTMAIAGPIASILVAAASFGIWRAGETMGWPETVGGVFWYLGIINGVLAAFNLVPAFPLDGGRVLRSVLWGFLGSLRKATRITAALGSGFGIFLVAMGVLNILRENYIGGIWLALLGLFVRAAASGSYQQLLVRRVLEGEPIRRFVQPDVQTVEPDTNLRSFVEDYVYRHHFKMFPVVEDDRLVGCVSTRALRDVPREEWESRRIAEIVEPCSAGNTIDPDADALKVLSRMHQSGASRMLVARNGHLEGIISLKDMMRLIAVKLELEEGEENVVSEW